MFERSRQAEPGRAQWVGGPDRVDRAIGVGALLMLAAVSVAIWRGRTEWAQIPWPVWCIWRRY